MHIVITGTRGIPNHHGGFERFAEKVSVRWHEKGHKVTVYNTAGHPFTGTSWHGVTIIHKPFPCHTLGSFATLIYDYLCFRDAYRRKPDVILNCGHGNSFFIRRKNKVPVVTLTDGLEWKRSGWHPWVRKFFSLTEKVAVKRSRLLVSDHPVIARWFKQKYGISSVVIPYGADIPVDTRIPAGSTLTEMLEKYSGKHLATQLLPEQYFLLIARFVKENHTGMILEGYVRSGISYPLLLIGDPGNRYGRKLIKKYAGKSRIIFGGAVYDEQTLTLLRHHSRGYIHGHSAGGTNPSLLEAMAAGCLITAHDNPFNRYILGEEASYFSTPAELAKILKDWDSYLTNKESLIKKYREKIRTGYSWEKVTEAYEEIFRRLTESR